MERIEKTLAQSANGPVKEDNVIEVAKKPERVFLGKTQDGADVYDRIDSHFHSEGGLTPESLRVALRAINTGGKSFIKERIDFDHPVGKQTCVEVSPSDEIVMVYRKGRNGQTPMVKNREAEPCSSIIAILRKDLSVHDKDTYELLTSYIGEGSPREPWDPGISSEKERQQCEAFWCAHALIYDDDLIDWEKTKEFEFMSEPAKKAEFFKQRTLFSGLLIDSEDLYQKAPATLEKRIKNPHVTTAFKPNASQLHLEQIGSNARIIAIGYGNDGENEGFLVTVEAEDPEIQAACDAIDTPHITLSISKTGQAKNTAFLEFTPLAEPINLTGEYGIFCQGKVIKTPEELSSIDKSTR